MLLFIFILMIAKVKILKLGKWDEGTLPQVDDLKT
jgi:hypothetical protein